MNALPPPDAVDADAPAPFCKQHPRVPAGWRCQSCEAALCPDCAVGRRAQTVELVACTLCGGGASPILTHRSRQSLAWRLKGAWRYVFTLSGLQVVTAVSLVLSFLGFTLEFAAPFLKLLPLALYGSAFWATFFTLVRDSSRGHTELETPEFTDFFNDAILPGIKGLTAFAAVWMPAIVWTGFLRPGHTGWYELGFILSGDKLPPELLRDPVLWALVLLGVAWLPQALIVTAVGMPPSSIFNVPAVLRMVRALGRDYFLTVGALVALGVLHLGAHGLAWALRWQDWVFISRILAEAVTLVAPFTAAHVLGLLLYVRGDSLGYGVARDYWVPILGETRPRLTAAPLREDAPLAALPEGVEAFTEVKDASRQAESDGLLALASAVEARDVPQAMALYTTLRAQPKVRVPPEHHLFVGQAAAVEGNFPLAVAALESAADAAPDEATAPRALVLLARVLGERMSDAARAEEVYRYVLHRYPDSSAARFARERVPPSSD
ncbi:tetratricopeptide repeat protein [Pyxidicoccus parkwayensis]|uniref:Tetratricopeptide repeat protein n=1 Tax=Pyxidicoccus parkwayensis TaxID=2813578 RepID=A0ABX7PBX4_9BACT|nr:B-box zinc finger protein [Pyxidicoccus parkwaysis]QSQ27883.1 tetratricopeptide repeat protein [Pyxidicoccus parkwaysis]